jgi:hypothetical protein
MKMLMMLLSLFAGKVQSYQRKKSLIDDMRIIKSHDMNDEWMDKVLVP